MKNVSILFISLILLTASCSNGGNETILSTDIIVGTWILESQVINGNETINDCKKQTQFLFESNNILRQIFYTNSNNECNSGNQIISSWLNIGNSEYQIVSSNGVIKNLEFTFSEENKKFSVSETNSNSIVTISYFNKSE